MSRSGYSDDCDHWELICWRGAVSSAIKGTRGQVFLRELATAMDATPEQERRLIVDELQSASGEFCAIGVLGRARGVDMSKINVDDRYAVARTFNIAPALAAEVVYMNDEYPSWDADPETPEQRWNRMRKWVGDQIISIDAAMQRSAGTGTGEA